LQEDASGGAYGSRGHSIAVSALAAFALFAAFTSAANLPALDMNQPLVLAGLLLGAAFPLLVAGAVVRSARLASQGVAVEVRRQFKEIPGLAEGQAEANYERCAEIGFARATRSLASAFILLSAVPLLGLLAKLFKAWFYARASATGGAELMGSVIFGAAMSGLIIGLMATSIGGIIGGAGRQASPADSPAPSAEALSTSGLGAALASAAAPALAYAPLIIAAAALLCTQWLS
jgi:K(+)-stimulated pyrophosphate-energized sodium pump